ncbi:MAG: hypothetical protein ABNH27_01195 [Alcanivorax sp.]|jgi:hypothetical protein|uniref:hypothetical protein n=1 Tax=Alcanivorax sp. TaxID=1872427 RepID=UPI0032D91197
MKLEIDTSGVHSKPVLKLAERLQTRFRPGSMNDISDAVVLSCYLYFSGKKNAAIELLNCFLYRNHQDKPESHRHLWVDNCQGLLLLAYIQAHEGLSQIDLNLEYIMGEESIVNPIKFMKKEVKIQLEDNSSHLDYAKSETPKHQCLTYAQQVLNFIPLVVLWPYYAKKDRVYIGLKPVKYTEIVDVLENNILLLQGALAKYS